MTADRDFLFWLRDRLVERYNENASADFVHKLECIAFNTDPKQDTPVFALPPKGSNYHLLGQTSVLGPRWYIWHGGIDSVIKEDITDYAIGQLLVRLLNDGKIHQEDLS